jgi:glycerol kinase
MTQGKDLILAIDQGTTGSTCLLVNHEFEVLAKSTHEFPQHFPKPGWVEHGPHELYASVLETIASVIGKSGIDTSRIGAIGITNQRETSLIWSRSNTEAIHRAVVWQDRRTASMCEALTKRGAAERVRSVTGLVLDPYFSGTKLSWMLDHVSGAREAAAAGELAAGTIDTYVLWRLTDGGVHKTEPSNACRTMLWPLAGGGWSEEMSELLDVPLSILPEVVPCTSVFGETRNVPGLPDGIPICGIAGDQQAALFGQACFEPGQAKCTYGTGAFAVLNTGDKAVQSEHGLLTSVAWQIGKETTYCLEGSSFMAGAVVQWLRDQMGFIEQASDIEALASQVEDSGGVVLVPGHAGLGAPHWRPHARGLIRGITRGTGRGHIARAALEGIALQIGDLISAMAADYASELPSEASGRIDGRPLELLRVDGGAAANDLLMQIQADVLGLRLERPTMLEATALGAISLAALGSGMFSDLEGMKAAWQCDRAFEPGGDDGRIEALKKAWAEAIAAA